MEQLPSILSSLGSLALIFWIVLAVVQLRLTQLQRREEIVMRLYEPLLSEPLTRAYWRVQTWRLVAYTTANGGSVAASTVAAKKRPASPGLRYTSGPISVRRNSSSCPGRGHQPSRTASTAMPYSFAYT